MRIRPCESLPAERAHGPPRGVEQHSASRGDLTEPEASRSIAPSSLAGRAEGEATAARQLLCARMGFWLLASAVDGVHAFSSPSVQDLRLSVPSFVGGSVA